MPQFLAIFGGSAGGAAAGGAAASGAAGGAAAGAAGAGGAGAAMGAAGGGGAGAAMGGLGGGAGATMGGLGGAAAMGGAPTFTSTLGNFGSAMNKGASYVKQGINYAESGGGDYGDIARAFMKEGQKNPQSPVMAAPAQVNRQSRNMMSPEDQIGLILQRIFSGG